MHTYAHVQVLHARRYHEDSQEQETFGHKKFSILSKDRQPFTSRQKCAPNMSFDFPCLQKTGFVCTAEQMGEAEILLIKLQRQQISRAGVII